MKAGRIKDRHVSFKLDGDLHNTLVQAAHDNDIPVSLVCRMALRNYLTETAR